MTGGEGDLTIGALQALQKATLLGGMGPRLNLLTLAGGDVCRAESRPPARLLDRVVRPENDLVLLATEEDSRVFRDPDAMFLAYRRWR